jgi:hypothetical protein
MHAPLPPRVATPPPTGRNSPTHAPPRQIRKHFPSFPERSPEALYGAINVIKDPSFIRVESDEVGQGMASCLRGRPCLTQRPDGFAAWGLTGLVFRCLGDKVAQLCLCLSDRLSFLAVLGHRTNKTCGHLRATGVTPYTVAAPFTSMRPPHALTGHLPHAHHPAL